MLTEAQKRAQKKYRERHYFQNNIHLPIEWTDAIMGKASEYGSVNAYIKSLVENDLKNCGKL